MVSESEQSIDRFLSLPSNHSFFLFGPRGTGKSTLILQRFKNNSFMIDLLIPEQEDRFSRNPGELIEIVKALPKKFKHVVIDEIQKIPKLLDPVHSLIESTDKKFILTGSSARKLKRGFANLLAGRAFVYHLHPFSALELGKEFSLSDALRWGLLPKIHSLKSETYKTQFLQAYAHSYLKEEVWAEQFVQDLDPFRRFLEVAAQMNAKVINFSNISRDVGVDDKTIKKYYTILEDTLLGFFLEGFHHSFRKRLSTKPKFYFFDPGITKALNRTLSVPLVERTSAYGEAFEHFIILECIKLATYYKTEYKFSYLMTKDGAEIDLVVERPGKSVLLIEIKSSKQITKESLLSFIKLTNDFGRCEAICLSNDPYQKKIEHVKLFPWQIGIKKYFLD